MRAIGIVPARRGSRGLPGKNIARIHGVSLLELAVRVGVDCRELEAVYVSTDDSEYERMAVATGALSLGLRSADLSGDTAKSVDVVLDMLKHMESVPDVVVLLQPTAPVRTPADIRAALKTLERGEADAVVSVELLQEPHPCKLKRIGPQGYLQPFMPGSSSEIPRQELRGAYRLSGAIYATAVDAIRQYCSLLPPKTLPYVMEPGVNIDSERDLFLLHALLDACKLRLYGIHE